MAKKNSNKKASKKMAVKKAVKRSASPRLLSAQVRLVEDELRDIINWVKVFESEYSLPSEVVQQLTDRLSVIAEKVGQLR